MAGPKPEDYGLLKDWVYAESRLIHSGGKTLLSAHAKAQLSRALNAKKLVAVVGSGVSAGYGMPSWEKLLEAMADSVIEYLSGLISDQPLNSDRTELSKWLSSADKNPAPSENFLSRLTWPGLAEALQTFRDLNLPNKVSALESDKLAVAFEATENLFSLCRSWARSRETNAFLPREIERQAHVELREQLKWRLKDDRGRIELLFAALIKGKAWTSLVTRKGGQLVSSNPKDEAMVAFCRSLNHVSYYMSGQNGLQSRGSDLFAAAFGLAFYDVDNKTLGTSSWGERLAEALDPYEPCSLAEVIATRLNEGEERVKDTPDKRFLIDAAFALLAPDQVALLVADLANGVKAQYDMPGFPSDGVSDGVPVRFAYSEHSAKRVDAARRVARAKIPKVRDPIAIMVEDLRIKRFLTTNYDNQFDSYFASKGFEEVSAMSSDSPRTEEATIPTGSRSIVQDLIGNHAEFTAYEVGAAPFLFDFGADTRDSGHRIVHIHGRAAKRESWLVLSERDYRERYARDDEPSERGDDAMRLVFTANPLLFVGLGMNEPDILRPLRAFTQGVGRLIDRPAIAMLPQEATATIDDEWHRDNVLKNRLFDVEKLDRYGVYVLRYGEPAERAPVLANFLAAADKDNKLAVKDLLGPVENVPGRVLPWIHDLLGKLKGIAPLEDKDADARQTEVLSVMRDGVKNAIRTHFACQALKDCALEWDKWLKSWSATPMRREPFGHQLMGVTLANRGEAPSQFFLRLPDGSKLDAKAAIEERSFYSASRHRILLRDSPDLDEDAWVKHAQERVLKHAPPDAGATPPLSPFAEPTVLEAQRGPKTDRFFAGAPSPAFPLLQASLEGEPIFNGRLRTMGANRILFLLGARGSGRGQMFNAMQSPRRFAQLCAWMGLIEQPSHEDGWLAATQDIHRGFFNLGLSHEVISVFDRLTQLLCNVLVGETRRLEPSEVAAIEKRLEAACANRIRRLRFALDQLRELHKRARERSQDMRRTVVVIDHLSVLFTVNGRPKNAQARRIYEAMIAEDEDSPPLPVDFIFLTSEDHVPYNLRCKELRRNRPDLLKQIRISTGAKERRPVSPSYLDPIWLKPPHLPEDKQERGRRRLVTAQIWNTDTQLAQPTETRVFVHLLESVRPATLAARFFPRLAATMLALNDYGNTRTDSKDDPLLFFGSREDFERRSVDEAWVKPNYLIEIGDDVSGMQGQIVTSFERIFGGLRASDWETLSNGHDLASALMDEGLDVATLRFPAAKIFAVSNGEEIAPASLWEETLEQVEALDLTAFKALRLDANGESCVPQLFRTIIRAVGHNRYALTVVLAALDDMVARRIPNDPEGCVNPKPLHMFVEKIRLATNGREPGTRADIVVDLVQDLYKTDTLGGLGRELPAWPFRVPDFAEPIRASGDADFTEERQCAVWEVLKGLDNVLLQSLQEEILIVLAKIGQPVTASAICAIGSIAELLDRIIVDRKIKGRLIDDVLGGKRHIAEILILIWTFDLLVHRCLIFRVAPKGDEMEVHGRINHRFATHKVLRRTIFARFNMPLIDFSDVDQLTVSLFTTQPNDLPRPGAETHRRNRQLVDQLATYQQKPNEVAHSYGDAFGALLADDKSAKGQTDEEAEAERKRLERNRLRAAYGILRSIYSVGVVSRFSTHEGGGQPVPEHGYFESHRLRVRWLLRKAVDLDDVWTGPNCEAADANGTLLGERTFHAEEIVWLFNECGVLSLAQGRLTDAAALLGHARLTARDFLEGSEWGALHARIGLNLAVTSIERGRLSDAEATLHQILNDRRETDPLHLIADGYLGEIDACRGMIARACETFERTANGLAMIRRSRASAIMMIYHANLLRQSDPEPSLEKARTLATAACDLATQGGHEDIRQLGQLALAWIDIARTEGRATAGQKSRIDRRLDAIGEYAKVMSMPRLQCQVALARSAFLISEGEFRMAAETAQVALQWATRHDMEIKKISALGLLGTAMLRQANRSPRTSRRAFNEAELLLRRARDLAYNMGFTAQVTKIEQVLTDYA